jgi:prophage regulatory protein
MRVLIYEDLRPAKGIGYSKVQLWRLEKQGRFPKRITLGQNRYGWAEHEIDAWLESRIRARDKAEAVS